MLRFALTHTRTPHTSTPCRCSQPKVREHCFRISYLYLPTRAVGREALNSLSAIGSGNLGRHTLTHMHSRIRPYAFFYQSDIYFLSVVRCVDVLLLYAWVKYWPIMQLLTIPSLGDAAGRIRKKQTNIFAAPCKLLRSDNLWAQPNISVSGCCLWCGTGHILFW